MVSTSTICISLEDVGGCLSLPNMPKSCLKDGHILHKNHQRWSDNSPVHRIVTTLNQHLPCGNDCYLAIQAMAIENDVSFPENSLDDIPSCVLHVYQEGELTHHQDAKILIFHVFF